MKTLSVKQPWAYLICSGIKDIENRTWKTKFRGRVLIHASGKQCDIKGLLSVKQQEYLIAKIPNKMPLQKNIVNGSIIGSVEIVDCVVNNPSIWAKKMLPNPKWEDYHNELGGNKELFQYNLELYKKQKTVYNLVLANPILFDEPILNVKGKLGFWDYEFDESTFDCTNDNPYVHQGCNEKQGCIQCCDDCEYWKSKYDK